MSTTNKDVIEAFAEDFRYLFMKPFRPNLKISFDGDKTIAEIRKKRQSRTTINFFRIISQRTKYMIYATSSTA